MANSLLQGPTEAPAVAPPEAAPVGTPTWGYRATDGTAELFHLAPGEALPAGYVDSPAKVGAPEPAPVKPASKARKEA